MKIMTFNTQHCLNYVTKEIDFPKMAETIMQLDPDIVGLNEMRGESAHPRYEAQVENLAKLSGMPYFYFAPAIYFDGKNPYGNGILSKYPIENPETIIIPDPVEKKYTGYYETRCVLKAKIEDVTVLVTHMGLNPDEAENAVKTMLANKTSEKCVMMGDFNLVPTDPLLAPIFEAMTDTAEAFSGPKLSFPSDVPDRKIDYIFVSRDGKVKVADIPAIVASDHRPHTATVEF